jgi:hypothetical protein
MDKCSLYVEGENEALRHKWIESEKAGRDLGFGAVRHWAGKYWKRYLRAKWIEHLTGRRYWVELDRNDFGLLRRQFTEKPLLVDRILDRIEAGWENLDILCWALDWGLNTHDVLSVLTALDMNGRRLDYPIRLPA